jgi:uncharacterized protein (DUF2336 family)
MAENSGSFALLIELAKENSSEKRRELLRLVTDTFLASPNNPSDGEAELFDEIVGAVAADLETQVRAELARKVATSRLSIRRTARRLAFDTIEVAGPVIEGSVALTQSDLVEVIQKTSQDHMLAVTQRTDIGEKVSSALVAKGETHVVASLLKNETAKISRESYERVADRAQNEIELQDPLVHRKQVPLDLLNAVYMKVSGDLRREIMTKFQGASTEELDAALEATREHLASAYGALPRDYALAKEYVDGVEARGLLQPSSLEMMLRDNKTTSFLIGFSRVVDIDFELASRLMEEKDLDAIAMLCRASCFESTQFIALCMLIIGGGGGVAKAQRYGQLYERVPVATARRALRFWKIRAQAMRDKAQAA